jgi:hypothetical protein
MQMAPPPVHNPDGPQYDDLPGIPVERFENRRSDRRAPLIVCMGPVQCHVLAKGDTVISISKMTAMTARLLCKSLRNESQ